MRDPSLGHEVVLNVSPEAIYLLGSSLVQLGVDFDHLRELVLTVAHPPVPDPLLLPLLLRFQASVILVSQG